MKKITFCFALLLLATFSSFGQVQIGDGTFVDKGVPFEPSRNYSYAQSIYLASEILATGTITSIQYYYAGENNLDGSQELTIYMGHSTKTVFSSASNWEPIGNLTLVYTGGVDANGPGWVTFYLDAPFAYNGTDNLVIAFRESSDPSDFGDDDFYTYEVPTNRSLTFGSFSVVPNPSSPSNGTLRKFVPIIIFDGINQACPKPADLAATQPTTTGITLSWSSTAQNPGESQYYISTSNVAPTATTEPTGTVQSAESVTITTGLQPGTHYYAWVRDICDTDDGMVNGIWWNAVSFTTVCAPIPTFEQNFNATANTTLPTCWSSIVTNPQGGPSTATIGVTNEDGFTGKSVEFYRNGDGASDMILISPPVSNLNNGTHRLRFQAKNFLFINNANFLIGTLEENIPGAPFNQVDQVTVTNTFNEFVIDFTGVETTDTYIGIKLNSYDELYLGYIDDIVWELAPQCPDVSDINFPTTSTTSITVAWTSENVDQWDVAYSTSATTDPDTLTPIAASENPTATISELSAETTYYVWVRANCPSGAGFWVGPVAITTPCLPINDFYETFDSVSGTNLPNCWSRILRGETLSMYAHIVTVMDGANSQPKAVELFTGYSEPSEEDDIILVSPNLGNLSDGTHRLKFFASGEGNLQIGTLTSNTDGAVFTPIENINPTPTMTEYIFDFGTTDNPDTYIGLRYNTTLESRRIFIDDMIWEVSPSCPDITNISVIGTTTNATSIGWDASEATKWEIVYGDPSVSDPNTLTPLPVLTSPSIDLNDLTSNTTYKIWIRSVCDADGNGSWSYPIFITTLCDPVNTFSETFESAVDPNLPSCWSSIVNLGNGGIYLISWQPYAGAKGVELSSTLSSAESGPVLVSPPVANIAAGTNRVRFVARRSGEAHLEVGTVVSDSETSTFTSFQTVELTENYEEYIVDFTSYTGEGTNIGFHLIATESFTGIIMDNIVWEVAPGCTNVTDLEASGITTSTANVTWSAGADETSWEYVYAPNTTTDPGTLTPTPVEDTPSIQLSDLTSGTYYNVWVRSVCGESAFGSWVGVTFATKCQAATLPYIEDFESAIIPDLPICSTLVESTDGINWITANSPGNGFASRVLSYGPNDNNTGNTWFFTRGISLTAGENYTISYKYGNNSSGLHESLLVKFGTSDTVEAMTLDIADHPDVTGATPQTSSVPFTVPATGVYYFGFKAYSSPNQWKMYLDDINIEANLSNGDFDNSNFTFYPNPVKDVLNLTYKQNISTVEVYNLLGQKVNETKINSNTAQINMASLASGSYIVKVISENQTKIIKVIKE